MKSIRFVKSAVTALALSMPLLVAASNDGSFLQTAGTTPAFQTDFTIAAEKTVNSVVSIQSYQTPRQQYYSNPFGDFFDFFGFGMPQQPRQQQPRSQEPQPSGSGSGVIVSADGYIVTNHHVIADAEKLEVLLNDNSTYTATVIGSDEATDLALLKIDAKNLTPIVFGNSDLVKVGEWVLAVGNPFGLNSTVTAGIISARGRALDGTRANGRMGIESYLQTDAAINPGNSGGALVNLNGELIGINAAIYSRTGSYTGYSFAIPTSIVSKVISDIRKYGTVQRAVLGIACRQLDAQLARELGITTTNSGVVVMEVEPGGAGAELGLEKNDVIVDINSTPIHTFPELQEKLSTLRPGDKVTVKYYHDNKLKEKTATLKNSQGTTDVTVRQEYTVLGARFEPLSQQERQQLGINYGIRVKSVESGSPLAKAGVKKGSVILTVNEIPARTENDFKKAYDAIVNDANQEPVMWITGLQPGDGNKKFYCAIPLKE